MSFKDYFSCMEFQEYNDDKLRVIIIVLASNYHSIPHDHVTVIYSCIPII